MSNFQDLITRRRSIRKYTEQKISPEHAEIILKAALKSPTSKNARSWRFLVIEDKEQLAQLSQCKNVAAKFIADCAMAIVVLGDPLASDVWIEDTSIASIVIQLQAESLGLGSCWVQIRERSTAEGTSSEEYIRLLFDIPLQLQVLSVIAIGHKEKERSPFDDENLEWEKIQIGNYTIKQ